MAIKRIGILFSVLVLTWVGCKQSSGPKGPSQASVKGTPSNPLNEEQKRIKGITDSETLIQALSAKKSRLTSTMTSGPIDIASFADTKIDYLGIDSADPAKLIESHQSKQTSESLATIVDWPLRESATQVEFEEIWAPILKTQRFDDAQFGVLKGTFLESGEFELETKFEGRIRFDDRFCGVKAYQTLTWKEVVPGDWKIVGWKQKKLQMLESSQPLFENTTASAFPDVDTFTKISTATHQDLIVTRCGEMDLVRTIEDGKVVESQAIKEARAEYKGCNDWGSVGQYPSVSTVDFDQDGFDDLFLTDRWQPPQLLRNRGDGTFEDVTASSGLDVPEMVTCGYFFDYDNDGDSDLFLGMSMVPSRFFVNDGGTFVPHDTINKVLEETRFVNAVSIADINRDGLLDMYLSTYATGTGPIDDWIGFITREKEQLKTRLKIERADKFVDRGGPPNILLMNRGDTFEWVKITDQLKQYRNSYQTSWTDYDEDGDLDLYVCNDFAPDVFLRNETEQGSFKVAFTDVTETVVPTMDMGFGMGCSWGDFDNDGDLDLYVSNMYSKAGNRIVDQVQGADPRLKVAAHGNFLFENIGSKFQQIAGDEAGQQHVARVGWSYGGQFADFDNDGALDIYVPSGCYSAPQEVKTKIDL